MQSLIPEQIFLNPEKKPLGELILVVKDDGVKIKVPALNKRWAPRECFTQYLFLVGSGGKIKTGADLDEWLYEGDWFLKDMRFLLSLQHYEFWSYMVYQKTALYSVVSFLKQATPFYLNLRSLTSDERVITLYENILTAVGRIICRIITNKESDEEWITKDHLKDLIYSNFLISIPMLFDLIIALGETNSSILGKIFRTVFEIEPKYTDDLTAALQYYKVAFDTVQEQADNEGALAVDGGENNDLETPYDDLVFFTLDFAFTLSILLEVYPNARKICCDIKLAQRITSFYDNTIPCIYKYVYLINGSASCVKWLYEARVQLLRAFRSIVNVHIDAVLTDPENSLMPSEDFIGVMTECLGDRTFVIDYQRLHPIELDIDILKQACKELDEFKTDFVAKGYKDEAESASLNLISNLENLQLEESEEQPSSSKAGSSLPKRPEPEGASFGATVDYDDDKPSTSKAAQHRSQAAKKINDPKVRDIDLEVATVLEVLPDLGDGFIRRVLNRYDNSEEAIAAILEQNLPPDLMHSDQSEVYIPPDIQDTLYQQTGVKRYNVFDGDKYDVMTQDNPECIIKIDKGFPGAPRDLGEMLDDKKDLNAVRHRYQEYTLVEEGGDEANLYDDDYDDSYDVILESETRVVRPQQLREKLAEIADSSGEESDEEPYEEEASNNDANTNSKDNNRMNFCENPEDIRARYEARRAAKFANSGRAPPPQPPRDVVGKSKGQGQSKEVLVNRHKKDVNKSSRANHNRKAGASFKRSKGMIS